MSFFVQILESRRLFAAGSLDLTYGGGIGYGIEKVTSTDFTVTGTAVEPEDRILVAASITVNGSPQPFLARYSPDGFRETRFAGSSLVTGNPRGLNSIDLIATQPDGKILLFDNQTSDNVAAVVRLTVSGKIDNAFGKKGAARFPFLTARNITVGADGSILVLGDDGDNVQVVKLTSAGKLDSTFSSDGVFMGQLNLAGTNSETVTYNRTALFASETSDGKVLIGGSFDLHELSPESQFSHPFVARLTSAGIPDTTFNGNGTLEISDQGDAHLKGMAAITGGEIILSFNTDSASLLMRLNSNGSTDTSYGVSGLTSVGGASHGILAQDDGKIIVGTPSQLIRFTTAGEIDSTFNDHFVNSDLLAGIGSDGSIMTVGIAHKQAQNPTLYTIHPTRRWTEQAPAGLPAANDMAVAPSGPYRFSIQWRAELGVFIKSLASNSIQIVGPNGATYKAAFLGTTKTGNGVQRTANYKFAPPGGSWDASDNGAYTIRVLGGYVKDTQGDSASRRDLGTFVVSLG